MLRCQFQKDLDVKMGESEDVMEYDQEHIFRHLYVVLLPNNKEPV